MENENKEAKTLINFEEEIEKEQTEIYPKDESSEKCDKEVNELYNIEDWSKVFYYKKPKIMKDRFIKLISNSEHKSFFEGLDYEYGINGKNKDIQKAFQIYKKEADNSTDTLCMFKMYNIYLRLSNISPEFQEEFFQKIKKDFLDKQREFRYIKTEKDNLIVIFSNILKSNTYREFEVRMENYEYSCALEDMGNSNQELISEINSLKKELNKVKSVNSEIMSSNSWKITAPFRAINRFLNNNNDRD